MPQYEMQAHYCNSDQEPMIAEVPGPSSESATNILLNQNSSK